MVYLPLWKNISQVGWLFPIYGKIKKMFQTTNQLSVKINQFGSICRTYSILFGSVRQGKVPIGWALHRCSSSCHMQRPLPMFVAIPWILLVSMCLELRPFDPLLPQIEGLNPEQHGRWNPWRMAGVVAAMGSRNMENIVSKWIKSIQVCFLS